MFSWLDSSVFVLQVRDGALVVTKGQVSRRFVEDCEVLVRDAGLTRGKIRGVRRGRSITLAFSRHIPKALHQRFRNSWNFHGR